jgi:small acid-soluble spore protein (thioredoxin-like protein)
MPRPKPDDRSDNVEKLQEHIDETFGNLRDAEDHLAAHKHEMHPQQAEALEDKNRRRREAIEGFREEIKDEAHRRH